MGFPKNEYHPVSACIVAWGQATFPGVLKMTSDGALFWELSCGHCVRNYFFCFSDIYVIEFCRVIINLTTSYSSGFIEGSSVKFLVGYKCIS